MNTLKSDYRILINKAYFGGFTQEEIAEELGLSDKVSKMGWAELSAEETGRIGGLMAKRKRNNLK